MTRAADLTIPVRDEDALDQDALRQYLCDTLGSTHAQGALHIRQFAGGASNLTYLLGTPHGELILRRPPAGTKAASAHDMGREFRVLSALRPHYPCCPEAIAYCPSSEVLGRPFYLMSRIDGLIPGREMPVTLNSDQHRQLCDALIDRHVELHQVDCSEPALAALGKPEGYVQRQVSGWSARYQAALTDQAADADALMQWLEDHQPPDRDDACLIHNDYKFDNVVLDPEQPTRIIGVLDWEMATLGDPLMDLGCSLAYWIQADDPPALQAVRQLPTQLPGMMTRQQLIEQYASRRRIDPGNLHFHQVFGLFRLAVIVQQIHYRYAHGQTSNPKFSQFGQIAQVLIHHANHLRNTS